MITKAQIAELSSIKYLGAEISKKKLRISFVKWHTTWCYVMLCYVMLCYVMLCYVMLCYVMLCYVMLC